MRILFLTQWFDPEPTLKGLVFANELKRRGHEIQVVTGFPNYPGGKLYDGYRVRLLQREDHDGVSVLRVPLYPSHDGSARQRVANYLSFALSSAIMGSLLVKPADVMYVYHPPATVGFAATIIGLSRRLPFVYDVQDLWPDTLAGTGMVKHQFMLDAAGRLCDSIYRQAGHVVVLSAGFRRTLISRGVPSEKVDVIYNWCDETQRAPGRDEALARDLGMAGRFNVVFAGTMGRAQALDAVLEAAKLVSAPEVQFVFIGGGIEAERLRRRADVEGIRNCSFLPRRPVTEIGPVLGLADVLLVHLRDEPLFRITIPSKTQAYMAVGRPILMAVRGDAADLVQRAEAGICCAPEQPAEIAAAIMRMYTMPTEERARLGANGQRFYDGELSMSAGVDKFERIFANVAAGK